MKFIPWLLSAVLAVVLLFTWQGSDQDLAEKNQEIDELKHQHSLQLADANRRAADANQKLFQLTAEADKKTESASGAQVPVHVTFRVDPPNSNKVATITNTSGETITISVNVQRPATGQNRTFVDLTIIPGKAREISEREGWGFVEGDLLTVNQPNRASLSVRTS